MFLNKVIHRDFSYIVPIFAENTDEKRLAGPRFEGKVIHSFPRENMCILWIRYRARRASFFFGCGGLCRFFGCCVLLFLNERADGIRDVDALGAVAVGERLDELVLDDVLIVEHT